MHCITQKTKEFPVDCLRLSDPPACLYVRGSYVLGSKSPTLGIVGSRKMTDYGKRILELLVPDLVARGVVIVSGLAFGVDAYAHTLTLSSGGITIGVLGSGIENITPRANRALGKKILATGALVSEYAGVQEATRYSFPARNRIVASLSDALLVVEGTRTSGALITADFMQQLGKDVFAVPGSIFAPLSQAPNFLLSHGAHPCLSSDDLYTYFGFDKHDTHQVLSDVSAEERIILDLLETTPHSADQLCEQSTLAPQQVNSLLTQLELRKYISKTSSGTFTRY